MEPQLAQPTLADHFLILKCLAAHGFQPTGRSQFSNGRGKVHFEGTRLVSIPGSGSRMWRSEVGSVPSEAVVALLNGFLATPPFLSQQEIDRRLERIHAFKIALDRIVEIIREAPEVTPRRELRRFLWSMFNGHHLINLWRLRHALDQQQATWVTEVFTAWMGCHVSEELLRRALTDSGEMERSDSARAHLSSTDQRRLDDAVDAVTELLRTISPGSSHAALTRALALLHEAGDQQAR